MTNSGWLARAKHYTVIQILYRGYSVLKDAGRWVEEHWALGGRALRAARRAGAGRSGRAGVRSRRGVGRSGRAGVRSRRGARQAGRASGRHAAGKALAAGAQGGRCTGGRRAGARGMCCRARGACAAGRTAGALLGAWSSQGTGDMRAAMHGLGVAWALDGCAGWASWASFGAQCTWLSSGSVFGPGSTRYFPESPNEHCSL